jgi:hypothetical protein
MLSNLKIICVNRQNPLTPASKAGKWQLRQYLVCSNRLPAAGGRLPCLREFAKGSPREQNQNVNMLF